MLPLQPLFGASISLLNLSFTLLVWVAPLAVQWPPSNEQAGEWHLASGKHDQCHHSFSNCVSHVEATIISSSSLCFTVRQCSSTCPFLVEKKMPSFQKNHAICGVHAVLEDSFPVEMRT
uniref:Putative secreted protein n=1 Tax=Amblyomma triste TaxID=251400 RepID=A0A023G251_AMBTT